MLVIEGYWLFSRKEIWFKTNLAKPQELGWKKIIEDKINSLRMDLTRLD